MRIAKLHRLFRRGSAKILSYVPGANLIQGTPEGLGFDELNEVSRATFGHILKAVSYIPLSGWKKSGAFRLSLEAEAGYKWSMIYKNALYQQDAIPALNRFPINPGPSEYSIYSKAEGGITEYLPTIFMCSEQVPGLHYRYLMQDLSKHYRPALDKKDILSVTCELAELHEKIRQCNYSLDENAFISYDDELSPKLKTYIVESLERYAGATNSSNISTICDNWEKISLLYDEKYGYSGLSTIIHGDSNLANILVHKQNNGKIKLIDWEWAGIGLPHQDLASLLKRAKPDVEKAALDVFSRYDSSLSGLEHQRLYEVCQLERGLIDCAFLAKQLLGSEDKTRIDIASYIEDSAVRVMEAFNKLTAGF